MKLNSLPKLVSATALALSLAVLPSTLSASAQTAPTDTGIDNNNTIPYSATAGDRDFDWGWLGLLGLIGLAGLARKNEEPSTRYRTTDEAPNRY
ncbi:conserved exported hypothetical protein [Planktothrix serta PCC 8927]|uniref:WGxxGxxG-CTERM domain-containing protein n=1 Tax=Planktothrix serta PCC 8927 TaxID=671068 RepID=A0A7Z9BUS5_9CYAN|nr:WGxxGxxG family protein [Planktothrix serta]VXD21418.1 conserved exported hypothetical protein [Planktothrix serta PCC 8927]